MELTFFFAGLERTSSLATGICLLSVGVGFLCAGAVSMKTGVGLLSPGVWIFYKGLVCNPLDSNIDIPPCMPYIEEWCFNYKTCYSRDGIGTKE